MKKEDRQLLYKLIEQQTRAEIISRHGKLGLVTEAGDYFQIKLQKEDQIRKLMFGSSDLIKLGLRWGLLEPDNKKEHKRTKKKIKKGSTDGKPKTVKKGLFEI
jgi:hypothetical protein